MDGWFSEAGLVACKTDGDILVADLDEDAALRDSHSISVVVRSLCEGSRALDGASVVES